MFSPSMLYQILQDIRLPRPNQSIARDGHALVHCNDEKIKAKTSDDQGYALDSQVGCGEGNEQAE
jgi:hypothetical protein